MMILQTLRSRANAWLPRWAPDHPPRAFPTICFRWKRGSLYSGGCLRMLKAGWVSSEMGAFSARNRKVRIYRITGFRAQTTGTRRSPHSKRMLDGIAPRDENGTIMKRLLERLRIRRSIAEELERPPRGKRSPTLSRVGCLKPKLVCGARARVWQRRPLIAEDSPWARWDGPG